MGDRGNIIIHVNGQTPLYLYTHWGGSELPQTLATALDRGRDRWTDEPYLARIIFCEMVRDDLDGTTGYGISTFEGDGGTDIRVRLAEQQVEWNGTFTFEEFITKYSP